MQINLVKICLCLWAVPAMRPRLPLGFLQEALEISQHHHASRDPEAGFLARKKLAIATGAEAAGIADLDPPASARAAVDLKGGSQGSPEARARGLHARELLAGLGLLVGAAASAWERPVAARAIAAEPAARPLLALQVGSALAALVAALALPQRYAPGLILANAAAHTALLLRGVLGAVEAKHCAAVQQYRRRLVGWSVWLDLRAHSAALAAGVAWSTASLALVLFVLVTLGRAQLFPWAWWASHAVLSVAVLALAASNPERHPAQPPVLLLLVNCVVGCAYGGPFSPPAQVVLVVVPLLQLFEAAGSARCLSEDDSAGAESSRYDVSDSSAKGVERQLLATLAGNQDSADFEQHLAAERRLCELYCAQDLLHCEAAPSGPELLDRYRTWVAQFATERAPLAVRRLPDGLDLAVERVELCPQASVHRAKQALLGMLRAPYARFLARKRRLHLSAGRISGETKPLPRWTLRRLLGFEPPANTTVV